MEWIQKSCMQVCVCVCVVWDRVLRGGQWLEGWRSTTDWGRQYPAGVAHTAHKQPPLVGWWGSVGGPV